MPLTNITPALASRLVERASVGALGQVDPQEVAALGLDEAGVVAEVALQRLGSAVAALVQGRLDGVDRASSIAPEVQNSATIACETMLGEM